MGRVQVQRMSVFAMGQRLSCLPATRIKDRFGLNRYEKVKRWMFRNGVEQSLKVIDIRGQDQYLMRRGCDLRGIKMECEFRALKGKIHRKEPLTSIIFGCIYQEPDDCVLVVHLITLTD